MRRCTSLCLVGVLLAAYVPPAIAQDLHEGLAQQQAEQEAKCRPSAADTIASDIYANFRISGEELVKLSEELRVRGAFSTETAQRYAAGERAWRFAAVAQAVYDFGLTVVDWDGDQTADWELLHSTRTASGFAAAVYRWRGAQPLAIPGHENVHFVLAYRGSDQWRDWLDANLPALVLPLDMQLPRAKGFARRAFKRFKIEPREAVIVGHSLGGRLAQLVADDLELPGYAFNAAVPKDWIPVLGNPRANPRLLSIVSAADFVNPATRLLTQSRDLGTSLTFSFCGPGQGHALGGMLDTLSRVARFYRERLANGAAGVGVQSR